MSKNHYIKLDPKVTAAMTPTAVVLYQLSLSRNLPTSISLDDFQKLCGVYGSASSWKHEAERVCREMVSDKLVQSAHIEGDIIHIQ